MIRKLQADQSARRAPFREDDVVIYPEFPQRKIIVAHCYLESTGPERRWIVREINGDSHEAAELRRADSLERN